MYDVVEYLSTVVPALCVQYPIGIYRISYMYLCMHTLHTIRDGVRIHERSINYNLAQPVTAASERVEYGGTGAF